MSDNEIMNLLIDYGRKCERLAMIERTLNSDCIPSYDLQAVMNVLLEGEDNAEENAEA